MKVLKIVWYITRMIIGGILTGIFIDTLFDAMFPEYCKNKKN